ncbi:hypothetical protein [Saccharibacillus sacchari]|uniref:hypothetical protein n=1 Tax=Saccharibacillus sacchari TaxID=456493 RepID=UPI0004ACDA9A|nr:hypothetical protein [Saccharibacillus sacchari]
MKNFEIDPSILGAMDVLKQIQPVNFDTGAIKMISDHQDSIKGLGLSQFDMGGGSIPTDPLGIQASFIHLDVVSQHARTLDNLAQTFKNNGIEEMLKMTEGIEQPGHQIFEQYQSVFASNATSMLSATLRAAELARNYESIIPDPIFSSFSKLVTDFQEVFPEAIKIEEIDFDYGANNHEVIEASVEEITDAPADQTQVKVNPVIAILLFIHQIVLPELRDYPDTKEGASELIQDIEMLIRTIIHWFS